ncbi:MAG: hypothetical protein ACFFFT_12115 [Candidatus Thorarchaeota archaeon]
MTQIIEKIIKKKSSKIEQAEKIGDLNPRYFEEGMSPENALEKIYSSATKFSAKYNAFMAY